MISVLRKVIKLNIKYRKKWDPTIDVSTGAPPDKVTALCACKWVNTIFIKIVCALLKHQAEKMAKRVYARMQSFPYLI